MPVRFAPITGSDLKVTITAVTPGTTTNYTTQQPQTLPVAIAELGIPGVQRGAVPAEFPAVCRARSPSTRGARRAARRVDGGCPGRERHRPPAVHAGRGPGHEHPGHDVVAHGRPRRALREGQQTGYDVDTLVLGSDATGTAMVLGPDGAVPVH